ncbi:hypothetical protein [Nocardioides pocheonensis]|uniref:Peptidase MA-like domain-containing protein n=1 Tax=Nocardioides pocheonensis TaxID=661485 RepID=A0A3N0GUJ4_9ACTN|nr:hypothetical protein [Nocardioides pocheonensis]RNM16099.1 hypothetical protein EFL26_08090 [Nocardioides pocheonensis]
MRSTRRATSAVLLVVLTALGAIASACSSGHDAGLLGAHQPVSAPDEQALLDRRAAAIGEGNLDAFLATVDTSDARLVARQRRYFANLRQLPIQSLRYTVLKSDWPAGLRSPQWGSDVAVPQVRVATQLSGFDTVPVQRVTGFAFARRAGRTVIVSELTGAGKQFPGSNPAPWDLVRIHVRSDQDTLQLYDDGTWKQSATVAGALASGIADVRSAVPFPWDGRAVVYVFSRPAVLNSFEGVPGGNIKHLGAMTFPMYAVLGQPAVAGIRFTLLPSSLRAGPTFLGRIVRHELTHVALGDRDDGVPTWFAEGIAEYMGAREIPQDQRRIASVALVKARQGVDGLPASRGFNGADQAWHYALSWMACDFIAATRGEPALWRLMDALHAGGAGTTDEQQDAVLETVLGLDGQELAQHAAQRILRIYG